MARGVFTILSVTRTEPGAYVVVLRDDGEEIPYYLYDSDPHGMAPQLREIISTLIESGKLQVQEA